MSRGPRRAMILAAGLGTRLRPLTADVPKPAVPLCGVPPVRWNLALLAQAGVEEVVVNTHWRPEVIRAAVGDERALGLSIVFSHEPAILGTGGGISAARRYLRDEPFFVVNGKLLCDLDLGAAFAFHERSCAAATMVLRPYPLTGAYGAVHLSEGARIKGFLAPEEARAMATEIGAEGLGEAGLGCGESHSDNRARRGGQARPCLFTGVQILDPKVFEYLPPEGPSCIKSDCYLPMIAAGEPVFGHDAASGYWAEPSTPSRYLRAALDLLAGRVSLSRFRRGGVDPFAGFEQPRQGVWIHPSAEVSSEARLEPPCWIGPNTRIGPRATVGPLVALEAGARVGAGAILTASVIWPMTEVGEGERLEGMIATGSERVVALREASSGL